MSQKKAGPQVTMILYFALLMSQLMMMGVGYFVMLPQIAPEPTANIFYIFLAISLVLLFLSHKFFLKATKKYSESEISSYVLPKNHGAESNDQKLAMIRQTNYILSWALGEAVTIYGLIMPIFGFGLPHMITFWTLGFANHLARRPLT